MARAPEPSASGDLASFPLPAQPLQDDRTANHVVAETHRALPVVDPHRSVGREASVAPGEEIVDDCLGGSGVGRDIEILGPPFEHQVAHRATHEIALEFRVVQAVENLESVALYVLTRYGVFRPGENARPG